MKINWQEGYKKWIDLKETSMIFYKARLWFMHKFNRFDSKYRTIDPEGYNIVFKDEFTGTRLDRGLWRTGQDWGILHPTANPWQYSHASCIDVSDGKLKLTNKYRPDRITIWVGQSSEKTIDSYYAHGEISAKRKFKYGIFEIRCKIPKGENATTAFWVTAPNWREFDVFEFFPKGNNKRSKEQTITIHWPNGSDLPSPHDKDMSPKEYKLPLDICDSFHTYTYKWTKDLMEVKFDGVVIRRITTKRLLDLHDQEAELIVGNGLTHKPLDYNIPSDEFVIDYVKVWQEKEGTIGDGYKIG